MSSARGYARALEDLGMVRQKASAGMTTAVRYWNENGMLTGLFSATGESVISYQNAEGKQLDAYRSRNIDEAAETYIEVFEKRFQKRLPTRHNPK